MWEVYGSQHVAKALGRYGRELTDCYDKAFAKLSERPRSGKSLKGYEDLFSLPITTPGGEHRIIYQLKPNEKVVYVVLTGPREEIYEILKRSGLK
jgi:mRNA-degrading endonuclease RelE of RelBE toxin-antitoxin system